MESVYLGLFQRIFSWVFDRILDPVYRFVSSLLTTVLNWVFREVLAPILYPVLEKALNFLIKLWMEIYSTKLYLLFSGILKIIDYLEKAFDIFIGLEDVTYTPPGATKIEGSLVEVLMQQKSISTVFWVITFGALGIALVLTIYGVAKSAFDLDFENKRPVSKVLTAMMKTFIQFFTVPFLVYFMLKLSTEILRGVTNALNFGNTTSLGRIVFVIASLNAAKKGEFNVNSNTTEDFILGASEKDTVRYPFYVLSTDKEIQLKDYGNLAHVIEDFNLADFDYLIGFIAAVFLLFTIAVCLIVFVQRVFELMLLYIVSPYFVCMIPLDDGERFGRWREMFIGKCFTGFGSVVGMRLFLMICPMIMGNEIKFQGSSPEMTYIMKLFFLAGGAWAMYKSGSMVTSLLSQQAGMTEANTAAMAGGMLYSRTVGMAMAKGQQALGAALKGRGKGEKPSPEGKNGKKSEEEAGKFNGPSKRGSTWKAAYPAGMKRSATPWKSARPSALSNSKTPWKSAKPSALSTPKTPWKSAKPSALSSPKTPWKAANPSKGVNPTALSNSKTPWKTAKPQTGLEDSLRGGGITIGAGRTLKSDEGNFKVHAGGSNLTVNEGGSVVSRQFSRGQITIGANRNLKPRNEAKASTNERTRSGITIGANRNLKPKSTASAGIGGSPQSKIIIGANRSLYKDLSAPGRFTGKLQDTIKRGDITIGAGRNFRTGDKESQATESSAAENRDTGRFTGNIKGTITRGNITIGANRNYNKEINTASGNTSSADRRYSSNSTLRENIGAGGNRNFSGGSNLASESGRYSSAGSVSGSRISRGDITIGAGRNFRTGDTSGSGNYSGQTGSGSTIGRGNITIGANRNYSGGESSQGGRYSSSETTTAGRGNIRIGAYRNNNTSSSTVSIPTVSKAEASSSGTKVGYSDLSIKGLQYTRQEGKTGKITRRNSI
ncbi:MAG: hypothetical protein HFG68_14730 [Hungatella sp.]|nr:hypothetical protein [Hungatella sp.]